LGELAKALSLAQGQMTAAVENKTNPFYKSNYADIFAIWQSCREPLSKNGLCVIQTIEHNAKGFELITHLVHQSGEWICSRHPVMPIKNDSQGIKAAVTYARRMAMAAIIGISEIEDKEADSGDDDGEAAMRPMAVDNKNPKPTPMACALSDLKQLLVSLKLTPTARERVLCDLFGGHTQQFLNKLDPHVILGGVEKLKNSTQK